MVRKEESNAFNFSLQNTKTFLKLLMMMTMMRLNANLLTDHFLPICIYHSEDYFFFNDTRN